MIALFILAALRIVGLTDSAGPAFGGASSFAPFARPTVGTGLIGTNAGAVEFATSEIESCDEVSSGRTFAAGSPVWWAARLSSRQAGETRLVWIVRRDGRVVERHNDLIDDAVEPWDCLLAGEPLERPQAGAYSLEIWDSAEEVLLSVGSFELDVPPSPTPGSSPSATTSVAAPSPKVGGIAFATYRLVDCDDVDTQREFRDGDAMWWSATVAEPQPAGVEVVWFLRGPGGAGRSGRVAGPADQASWQCLPGDPLFLTGPGTYRFELWDGQIETLLADGTFVLTAD